MGAGLTNQVRRYWVGGGADKRGWLISVATAASPDLSGITMEENDGKDTNKDIHTGYDCC